MLRGWRIPFRKIGSDFALSGITDENIIPLLHRRRGISLFTQDEDFFDASLVHSSYCLVWLDVKADAAAPYLRRFLKHPRFNTQAKRMGTVSRVYPGGIQFWPRNRAVLQKLNWLEPR